MTINILYLKKEIEKIKVLFTEKKFDHVIKKTTLLLKKHPKQSMLYNMIGLSYLELEKYENAIKVLLSANKHIALDASILCNVGIAYKASWNFLEALHYFFQALKINPKHVQSYVNLGNLETTLNKNELALDYYLKAYTINNNLEAVLTYLVLSYSANGKFEKAKEIIGELNKKFPNNTKSYQLYSKIHNYQIEDNHQKLMLDKIKNQNLNNEDLSNFYFALAKSFFDQKNIEQSA